MPLIAVFHYLGECLDIEDGRREKHDLLDSMLLGSLDQPHHAVLKCLHSLRALRVVNAVVHAVTGDNHLRLDLRQGLFQPLVDARPWEGVPWLGEAGCRLAGQADADDVERLLGIPLAKVVFHETHIASVLGDAVAQYHDPLACQILCQQGGFMERRFWVAFRKSATAAVPWMIRPTTASRPHLLRWVFFIGNAFLTWSSEATPFR